MTHRTVGFGRGFPRSWILPIAVLTIILGVAASGRLSRAIVADLIAGNYLYDNGPTSGALGIELEGMKGTTTNHVVSGNFIEEDRTGLGGADGVLSLAPPV